MQNLACGEQHSTVCPAKKKRKRCGANARDSKQMKGADMPRLHHWEPFFPRALASACKTTQQRVEHGLERHALKKKSVQTIIY
eukprot:1156008-Pelagomonas_calceolata.AAC.3